MDAEEPDGRLEATPDPSDEWRVRRARLEKRYAITFGADVIQRHEIEFYERFLARGERIRIILRQQTSPTSDFFWDSQGGTPVELRSILRPPATFVAVARAIRRGAKSGKKVFIIDLRDELASEQLVAALSEYNLRFPAYAIASLWVFDPNGVRRLTLK